MVIAALSGVVQGIGTTRNCFNPSGMGVYPHKEGKGSSPFDCQDL